MLDELFYFWGGFNLVLFGLGWVVWGGDDEGEVLLADLGEVDYVDYGFGW